MENNKEKLLIKMNYNWFRREIKMTDDKKDEEIIKLKKKIEELENKPKNKFF